MKTRIENSLLLKFFAVCLIATSVLNGCSKSKDTTTSPGANEVFIENYAFTPATITVAINTTITWTNKDGVAHTVTSATGLFDSGSINIGGTYSHTFATPGTYPYICSIHPYMTGTVVVQ